MRCQQDVVQTYQWRFKTVIIRLGLTREYIYSGAREMTGFQGATESIDINHCSA